MTTPQVLRRADHEARRPVVVERAAAHQITIGAVLGERDPLRLDQALQRHLSLQPGQLSITDPSHPTVPFAQSCQAPILAPYS